MLFFLEDKVQLLHEQTKTSLSLRKKTEFHKNVNKVIKTDWIRKIVLI